MNVMCCWILSCLLLVPSDKGSIDELGGDWQLVSVGKEPVAAGGEVPTLSVKEDGTVGGSTGVNRFGGKVSTDGKSLFGPLFTTRRAGPPDAMKLEAAYVKALGQATRAKRAAEQLELLGADGQLLLVFKPEKK